MKFKTILFDVDDGIVTITLNRPEKANTFDDQLKDDMRTAMETIEADKSYRVVILTGAGRHFCAGGDLNATRAPLTDAFGNATPVFMTALYYSRVPVIAAINGVAKGGGCELALACDFRIMSATARIGLPEIQFGLIPGGGGTQRLPRLVGIAAAKEMIFLGLDKTAEEALRIGLVNKVVAPDELMPSCVALARELALRPGYALAAAKRAINAGMDMKLADALNFERETHMGMGTPEERKMARDAAASKNATYAKIFGQNDTLL
jgi:enoyl-CoA hydratase/carnithine racemase